MLHAGHPRRLLLLLLLLLLVACARGSGLDRTSQMEPAAPEVCDEETSCSSRGTCGAAGNATACDCAFPWGAEDCSLVLGVAPLLEASLAVGGALLLIIVIVGALLLLRRSRRGYTKDWGPAIGVSTTRTHHGFTSEYDAEFVNNTLGSMRSKGRGDIIVPTGAEARLGQKINNAGDDSYKLSPELPVPAPNVPPRDGSYHVGGSRHGGSSKPRGAPGKSSVSGSRRGKKGTVDAFGDVYRYGGGGGTGGGGGSGRKGTHQRRPSGSNRQPGSSSGSRGKASVSKGSKQRTVGGSTRREPAYTQAYSKLTDLIDPDGDEYKLNPNLG